MRLRLNFAFSDRLSRKGKKILVFSLLALLTISIAVLVIWLSAPSKLLFDADLSMESLSFSLAQGTESLFSSRLEVNDCLTLSGLQDLRVSDIQVLQPDLLGSSDQLNFENAEGATLSLCKRIPENADSSVILDVSSMEVVSVKAPAKTLIADLKHQPAAKFNEEVLIDEQLHHSLRFVIKPAADSTARLMLKLNNSEFSIRSYGFKSLNGVNNTLSNQEEIVFANPTNQVIVVKIPSDGMTVGIDLTEEALSKTLINSIKVDTFDFAKVEQYEPLPGQSNRTSLLSTIYTGIFRIENKENLAIETTEDDNERNALVVRLEAGNVDEISSARLQNQITQARPFGAIQVRILGHLKRLSIGTQSYSFSRYSLLSSPVQGILLAVATSICVSIPTSILTSWIVKQIND